MSHRLPLTLLFLLPLLAVLLGLAPSAAAQPQPVQVSMKANSTAVARGGNLVIAVVVDHQDEWHTNPNEPKTPASWIDAGFTPWPSTLELKLPAWASPRATQWPKVYEIEVDLAGTGTPEKFGVYEGRAVVYVPVVIGTDAPLGPATIEGVYSYQACADVCIAPADAKLSLTIDIVESPSDTTAAHDLADFSGFDPTGFSKPAADAADPAAAGQYFETNVFGWKVRFRIDGFTGRILLLLASAFGGLILNLTPCVLPVIPIKIMSLQQTAKSPARSLFLGLVMSAGIVVFWMVIGAVIGTSTSFKAASQLIAVWWFTVGIGLFVGIMGVSMMGAFTINLPQWIYNVDANHESPKGSFTYGILTAILALPCVAPFAGTAMAIAATQGPALAIAIFTAIGCGMALPYIILAARPQWVSFVPSAGPASDLLKQIMGLLMLAAAVFFVGTGTISLVLEHPYLAQQLHWWAIAAILVITAIWLIRKTFEISTSFVRRGTFSVAGLALAGAGVWWAYVQTDNAKHAMIWRPYSREELTAAIDSKQVVVVDFTANWCLICKSLESAVLHQHDVYKQLAGPGVVPIKVDLSSLADPGWQYLKDDLKQAGIPLLVIYGPGLEKPEMSNAYTQQWVIDTIAKARGTAPAKTD